MILQEVRNKKKSYSLKTWSIIWSSFIVFFFSLFFVGVFFDWDISETLAKPFLKDNQYYSTFFLANFVEVLGSTFLTIMIIFCFLIFANNLQKDRNNKLIIGIRVFLYIIIYLMFTITFYLIVSSIYKIIENNNINFNYILIITLSLSLLLSSIPTLWLYFWSKKINNIFWSKILTWAIATFISIILMFVIVLILKEFIFRPRFRAIYFNQDNWDASQTGKIYFNSIFELNRKFDTSSWKVGNDFFKSFPSGHTTNAMCLLPLVSLPIIFEKINNRKWNSIIWLSILFIIIFFMFMRIVAGAHYLTDTIMAFGICFVLIIPSQYLFVHKKNNTTSVL